MKYNHYNLSLILKTLGKNGTIAEWNDFNTLSIILENSH